MGLTESSPTNATNTIRQIDGKTAYLCIIDTNKTTMSDFYKWNEINIKNTKDNNIFCWRTFYLFGNETNETWLPISNEYYKEILYIISIENNLNT